MTTSPFLPWPAGESLVLASRSPRRAELLRIAGIPFEVRPAGDVESAHAARLGSLHAEPSRYAEELAWLKALAVGAVSPGRLVLGADTIVVVDGEILEKPRDDADARAILARLAGRRHAVVTAIALCGGADRRWLGHERTEVEFLPLSADAIARYVATGEPLDKAGAYGIQGFGALMVKGVRGCYFNVMGLPLALLGRALREVLTGEKENA
ncbi:MAG TPA: Maf family protein [Candidatus Krumholzibacteria bacterium]|nr:Maf family protein [Candidatus Krumholzibacteria bacterium]HPD71110.1 Maf family protein [Candidatus Krumholzibacteria bacterium]HRY39190.1 Maf family protein [Candidatus Krumholzibacteria bacterium]